MVDTYHLRQQLINLKSQTISSFLATVYSTDDPMITVYMCILKHLIILIFSWYLLNYNGSWWWRTQFMIFTNNEQLLCIIKSMSKLTIYNPYIMKSILYIRTNSISIVCNIVLHLNHNDNKYAHKILQIEGW